MNMNKIEEDWFPETEEDAEWDVFYEVICDEEPERYEHDPKCWL